MTGQQDESRSILTWPLALAAGIGSTLLVQHLFLRGVSRHFDYVTALVLSAILGVVATQVAAGLIFMSLIWLIPRLAATRETLFGMVIFGFLLRLILFDSTPIL